MFFDRRLPHCGLSTYLMPDDTGAVICGQNAARSVLAGEAGGAADPPSVSECSWKGNSVYWWLLGSRHFGKPLIKGAHKQSKKKDLNQSVSHYPECSLYVNTACLGNALLLESMNRVARARPCRPEPLPELQTSRQSNAQFAQRSK